MASVLLAIVVGLAALGNYMLFSVLPQGFVQWLSVVGQAVLSVFAVIVFFTYQGRKETSGYEGYRVWTVARVITWLALFGSVATFVVMLLAAMGILKGSI
ncbi:hypothetical protein [Weissella confusa]|uniref:hypothetical protein n=1 Tax=Weissella confusa TaxID=1583 RepID=UPI00223B7A31|nr:hypothetical protein [Weissella confusa]MCT0014915.1 hypothetical protein [Weissella confusa]